MTAISFLPTVVLWFVVVFGFAYCNLLIFGKEEPALTEDQLNTLGYIDEEEEPKTGNEGVEVLLIIVILILIFRGY